MAQSLMACLGAVFGLLQLLPVPGYWRQNPALPEGENTVSVKMYKDRFWRGQQTC